MDLYLMTGFLGAGKTTTIKELLTVFKDKKVALIINEFGKTGVDGQILTDVTANVFEVAGGSIFCTCKISHFETVLADIVAQEPDIILVETSGLSDPSSAYQILAQDKFAHITYKGCICLVDALYFKKVIHTARVSKKQVRISDLIVINKIDLATTEQLAQVKQLIYELNPFALIKQTSYGKIDSTWLTNLCLSKKQFNEANIRDITLISYELTISESCTKEELTKLLESFIEDTYRVKGFLKLCGKNFLINCVGDSIIIDAYHGKVYENKIIVLSGGGLPIATSLQRTEEMYCNTLLKISK